MRRSSGVVSWDSTSVGAAPGMGTMTSTMGTTICGSSSRGVRKTAARPSNSDAMTISCVSLLRRKVCATRPAKPISRSPRIDDLHGLLITQAARRIDDRLV